jgi:hypothetical protein
MAHLTITDADETGYVVREGERLVGAFSTSADLCFWLEERLRKREQPKAAIDMPNVARPRDIKIDPPSTFVGSVARRLRSA